jgi:hypothetical protein
MNGSVRTTSGANDAELGKRVIFDLADSLAVRTGDVTKIPLSANDAADRRN